MDEQVKFIRKFQRFERILKDSTRSGDDLRFSTVLKKAAKTNILVKNKLSLILDLYALRNVLSHRERGRYIVKINKIVIKELEALSKAINNPPTVLQVFGKRVEQSALNDNIPDVMKIMHKFTYTHIPIWTERINGDYSGKLVGVFSYTSFFEWLAQRLQEGGYPTFTKHYIRDIAEKFLNSPAVNFVFIPENKSIYEIPPVFDKFTKQNKRLDCLLITKNGLRGEKVMGIITSWDLGEII